MRLRRRPLAWLLYSLLYVAMVAIASYIVLADYF
jgi:hypothetical protein